MAKTTKKARPKKRGDSKAAAAKDKARAAQSGARHPLFESGRLIEAGLFLIFTALVATIGFLGQKPKGPQVILNHPAPSRVVAEFPFSYSSQIVADERARAVRAEVPPVSQRTFAPYESFRNFITDLNNTIAKSRIETEKTGEAMTGEALTELAAQQVTEHQLDIDPEAIAGLTRTTTPRERSTLIGDALGVLKELYEDGIYSARSTRGGGARVTMIQLVDEDGRYNLPDARSLEDAVVALRVRLDSLSPDAETARHLFEIFRAGLAPNLLYSAKATDRAIEQAVGAIQTPVLTFKEGDTLVEPGQMVTPLEIERLNAYRAAEIERGRGSLLFNRLFMERVVLTLLLLLAVYIYVRQSFTDAYKRERAIFVTAVSILLNLLIIRLVIELGEVALLNSRPSLSMLPYIAPYALAPIIVAVLIGSRPAVMAALIVSALFGIIQNNSIEFFLIAFLSGVVGSFVSVNIRKRANLLRAGLYAGATAAVAGAAVALFNNYALGLVGQQTLIALSVGVFTGVLAVGMLPLFEQAFKITTEITLLELTDFNHPLLRRMQMEAPGTYHHSLMVANLSENAAASIGASPLLCRVCCLFHDIGKLVKPEYFVENQRGGINPHDEKNPSMSALVIKAHVKEGVEIARKHKLPRVIIDVIRQHHGTSLIQYFYFQARQKGKSGSNPPFPEKNGRPREEIKVDESTYRYDGPKPAFKESAIIFFADAVEAASRSLKKVTQPAVEELIDGIIAKRIEDGQLEECPLTFKELHDIRSSFVYTLLNMLHARIEYPKEGKETSGKPEDRRLSDGELKETANDAPADPGNQQPV